MPSAERTAVLRRASAELALLIAVGAFMAVLAPYGSDSATLPERTAYWMALIIGGGMIGGLVDELLGLRFRGFAVRLAVGSVVMTPAVTLLVLTVGHAMSGAPLRGSVYVDLLPQVLVICIAVMAVRQLVLSEWFTPDPEEPAADPALAFRQRLSARRREARLIAVQAEDHYLRVHTDAGAELITARFGDALNELAGVPGFRTHRSWWVAASALEAVRWRRGRGEARLTCGLSVPVSRSQAGALKLAGWR